MPLRMKNQETGLAIRTRLNASLDPFYADASELFADTGEIAPGTMLFTRREGFTYEVLPQSDAGPFVATAGGAKLVPLARNGVLSATMCGTIGGGEADAVADTEVVQLAIDIAIYRQPGAAVLIDVPTLYLADTLHVGYGDTFRSCDVRGMGMKYRGAAPFAGTALFTTFSDRPAINVQGGRNNVIERLTLVGLNAAWVDANELGKYPDTGPGIDDTDPAMWVAPTLHPNADTRYAPYAGLAVDAYSGSRPSNSYPDVSYPAYAGSQDQYGKDISINISVRDVQVTGFVVGVVNQPGNKDQNADFTQLSNCQIEKCKYAVSVGNSQSRNFAVRDCEIYYVWCAFTNDTHGVKKGKFNGSMDNISLVHTINIFKITNTVYAGPLNVICMYAESTWRIGDISMPASQEAGIVFQSCRFHLGLQTDKRGHPATSLGTRGTRPGPVVFRGCQFRTQRLIVINASNVRLEGCQNDPQAWSLATGPIAVHERLGHNATAGGFVFGARAIADYADQAIQYKPYDIDEGTTGGQVVVARGFREGRRDVCIPIHAGTVRPLNANLMIAVPELGGSFQKVALDVTIVGREARFTLNSHSEGEFTTRGPEVGDVVIDSHALTVYFVKSRDGLSLVLEAQNNFRNGELIERYEPTIGFMTYLVSRIYTPREYTVADLTDGSPTYTDVGRPDGYAAVLTRDLAVGDYVLVDERVDQFSREKDTKIIALDEAAKTITVSEPAYRSEARFPLPLFVRTPPTS